MPLLWRYLLRNYLQIFFLGVTGFIAILLVTRFQTIARFAASGASLLMVAQFILYQIPFVLPIAIPVSCLLAGLILFQRLSRSHELTALRVAGIGLRPLLCPLLFAGALLSVANFTIISEMSPKCRALSKGLIYRMTAVNPLCLLQKETLVKLKNTYADLNVLKSGSHAEDVIFITRNLSNQRLGVMIGKKLALSGEKIVGKDVTFISSIDSKKEDAFDHLLLEHQSEMETVSDQLTQFLRSSDMNLNYDYLGMRMIQAKNRLEKEGQSLFHPKAWEEIAKRLSLGLAAFTFTLLGIAQGMEISRTHSKKGVLWASGLGAFYLIAFVAAKSIKHNWMATTLCYLSPHLILLFFSLFAFRQIAKGSERL